MPTFSNVHAELENNELHPPRDFSLADNDTTLSKNLLGNLDWQDTFWQRPVLGFADATFPPLTLQHGDRYILFGNTNIGSTAIDTSLDTSMDTSMDSTATVLPTLAETPVHPTWGEVTVGDVVEFYSNDNKDRPVFEWRSVSPKPGYQVFNLADNNTYHFSGSEWKPQSATANQPTDAQQTVTYAELAQLVDSEWLVPGLKYWVSDRDIVLTAVNAATLSNEGDYTMPLKAYGYVELLSGTTGSIDSIVVDGVSLLPSAVLFDTSLRDTVALVAGQISGSVGSHGFSAIGIGRRIYLIDATNRGAALNGLSISVSATAITCGTSAFANGADKGQHWFTAKYRFASDYLVAVSDNQGNVVSCEPAFIDFIGLNPIEYFPWGQPYVSNNTVRDSAFVCFAQQAKVEHNTITGGCLVLGRLSAADVFVNNNISLQSFFEFDTTDASAIMGNYISFSSIDFNQASGTVISNRFIGSDCSLSGSTMELVANKITNTQLIATDASVRLLENEMVGSTIDLSGASNEFLFGQNEVKNNANISLQRAQGICVENKIDRTEITGDDSNTTMQGNRLSNYSTLVFTNYAGSEVMANTMLSATLDMLDSTCAFYGNQLDNSTVQMQRHSGECSLNVFKAAEITSNDSGSLIENNYIDQSNVHLSNTNGTFSSNKATFYSNYRLDGYLGERVTLNSLDRGSDFIATGNTGNHGGVIVEEGTKLDLSNQSNLLYDCFFKFPTITIFLNKPHVSRNLNFRESSLESRVTIDSSGIIDLGTADSAFSGLLWVENSETLSQISGLSYSPNTITIRPELGQIVNIDSESSQISFASGIVNLPIVGSNGGYFTIRNGNKLIVTELYTG